MQLDLVFVAITVFLQTPANHLVIGLLVIVADEQKKRCTGSPVISARSFLATASEQGKMPIHLRQMLNVVCRSVACLLKSCL